MTDSAAQRLGEFLRAQRQLAGLSLRQLAELARVSNPYLSQVERGLHEPSLRVLTSLAHALGIPPHHLLAQAGVAPDDAGPTSGVEAAVNADTLLTAEEKRALLAVYRSYVAGRSEEKA
ncbi:MAG TPA: helix-turn-helix transcriptional regulator [Mycobacteriales bacterium]|jgi:transcriptional regulator with XRE-family HTH domain|nr:helix-turn-helix transcriptional regulator [Mycobacteriales bacterium]